MQLLRCRSCSGARLVAAVAQSNNPEHFWQPDSRLLPRCHQVTAGMSVEDVCKLLLIDHDADAAAVATGGAVDNWVGRDAACQSQRTACSIRFGGAFSYTINTVAGRSYVVRFTFAEVWWAAAGQRQFNVLVDGFTVLSAVDPFALAGGAKFVPVVRQLTKIAAGSTMVINLQARVDNAALAALEVSLHAGMACNTPCS